MEHLGAIVQMYFQKVSSSNILSGELDHQCFQKDDFDALALANLMHLSETETNEIYRYLQGKIERKSGENGLRVFRALKALTDGMLLIRDNQPLCQYTKLLQWNELTRNIGQDLPICAFLAQHTERTGCIWKDFEWNTVIGHDNMQLNRMMQRGLADNHFHLFGSAPSFKLIWIKLMNELENHRYAQSLKEIDYKRRMTRVRYAPKYQEDSLEIMHFQAALIRIVLFYYLSMQRKGNMDAAKKVLEERYKIQNLLTDTKWALLYRRKVQIAIDRIKLLRSWICKTAVNDYADLGYRIGSIYYDFAGERAFIYQMLLGKTRGGKIPHFMMNWFYAYLVIQAKLREELVQVNQNIGFENFSHYSSRKKGFLYTDEDDRKMIGHAVIGSLSSGNIRSLEVRISPCATAKENQRWIQLCDRYILEHPSMMQDQLERIYYVFHFPKREDEAFTQQSGFVSSCRHYKLRDELDRKAEELIRFREFAPKEAGRVLGIDACAQEIGCRPEVFAPVFRRLSNHVVPANLFGSVRQWKITYHVGEDWMDFTDGLRAVDEAVRFLNMKNGDRLGHATVLGLDVKKWYLKKRKSICLPAQDYLDNLVWLYYKLIEFNIQSCETLKGFLRSEFDKWFQTLYHAHLQKDPCQYDIAAYYEAWKLRGDHPILYKGKRFSNENALLQEYWANKLYLDHETCREREEVFRLIYYYHYSAAVRFDGAKGKDFIVPDVYIDGVEKVQKAMQWFVAEKGIGIEANPSSNYRISTMDSYEDHPISKLYNMGLVLDPKEMNECTQMHISINTDDKGIFQTSLENEYALMGCALENVADDQGKRKYQKQMVYEWLDHVREHGNQQSFLPRQF